MTNTKNMTKYDKYDRVAALQQGETKVKWCILTSKSTQPTTKLYEFILD